MVREAGTVVRTDTTGSELALIPVSALYVMIQVIIYSLINGISPDIRCQQANLEILNI
jgi:hypothetical protein